MSAIASKPGIQPTCRSLWSRRELLQWGVLAAVELWQLRGLSADEGASQLPPPKHVLEWGRQGHSEGEFDIPIGIAINRDDEIFITDHHNNRVQKFDVQGKFLAAIPVVAGPGGIAIDALGRVIVSNFGTHQISIYKPTGELVTQFGGLGTEPGQLNWPGGIAIGTDGGIYVADQTNRRVQKFSLEGKLLLKWGEYGKGEGQFGGNSNPKGRVGGPQFLAFDSKGFLYTTEGSMGRIQKFTPDGKFVLAWGSNATDSGGFGGRTGLPGPIAIVFDKQDRCWISSTNDRVQQFTADVGKYLRGIGPAGSSPTGTGPTGTGPGQFKTPHGIALDSTGALYAVDTRNSRIQKFSV